MDLEKTVDTFKSGSPEVEVRGIAVSWMSTTAALKTALSAGCNLFITHEPTYYDHYDDPQGWTFDYEGTRSKRAFIEERRDHHHSLPRSVGSGAKDWHPRCLGRGSGPWTSHWRRGVLPRL